MNNMYTYLIIFFTFFLFIPRFSSDISMSGGIRGGYSSTALASKRTVDATGGGVVDATVVCVCDA
jgi:hypothetical protein